MFNRSLTLYFALAKIADHIIKIINPITKKVSEKGRAISSNRDSSILRSRMQRDLNMSTETRDLDEDNEYGLKVNLSSQKRLERGQQKIQLPPKNRMDMRFENNINTPSPLSISRDSSFDHSNYFFHHLILTYIEFIRKKFKFESNNDY